MPFGILSILCFSVFFFKLNNNVWIVVWNSLINRLESNIDYYSYEMFLSKLLNGKTWKLVGFPNVEQGNWVLMRNYWAVQCALRIFKQLAAAPMSLDQRRDAGCRGPFHLLFVIPFWCSSSCCSLALPPAAVYCWHSLLCFLNLCWQHSPAHHLLSQIFNVLIFHMVFSPVLGGISCDVFWSYSPVFFPTLEHISTFAI